MRRILSPSAASAAGLVLLLSGCSGESPTAPKTVPTPPTGNCNVVVTLPAGPIDTFGGTAVPIRATVTKGGQAVPDGTSVTFTTDFGFFLENSLPTVSKTTSGGAADVTPGSLNAGSANIRASFECASATVKINYLQTPSSGPFVSSIEPNQGSAKGGETVSIVGGRFGNDVASTLVSFGGVPASVKTVTNTQITVSTPSRTLANPSVPETVDVAVTVAGSTIVKAKAYTYVAIDPNKRIFVSSVSPSSGSPAGGEQVNVLGGNFGTSVATTRVTFCGLPATITSQTDAQIIVSTPKINGVPPAGQACDVAVTTDLGLVSQQSAVLPQAFTYRGGGGTGGCNTDPSLFLSSLSPNTGSPDGGTVINISGGGFPTQAASVRVDFGGNPAQIASVSPTQISVSTPRRSLANPDVPETVDVTVTDLGSPTVRCARLVGAFTYTTVALDPVIYSLSPKVGPNDASTRVTIFGNGFQFPLQVFMTGGGCGVQRIEGTILNPISLTNVVFGTPRAIGPYSCLSNSLVDVEVLNPSTGKKASCPGCFRYYGCPTVTGASPSLIPYDQTTLVTVSGNNFEEPVEATFQPTSPAGGAVRVNVTSVAAGSVIVQMPPLNQILQTGSGQTTCQNVVGTLTLTSTALTCQPVTTVLTYRVDPPSIASASPTNLNQDGSVFPAIGVPATITVLGTNFVDPVTVEITKGGASVATVNNAVVSSSGTLTFQAPALADSLMNRQNCLSGGAVIGSKMVPTSFGIRIRSQRTGCSAELPAILVYNPINGACTAGLSITTASLPNASVCQAYAATVIAGGGVPPYLFSQTGLPAGFTLNPASGAISSPGPQLTTGPVGGNVTANVTVTVTDNAATSVNQSFPLTILDPNGPFGVSGSTTGTLPGGVTPGTVGPYSASPSSTPAAFTPVTWSVVSINPSPGGFLLNDPSGIFMTPGTGTSSSISFPGGVTGGTVYTVVIQAVDTPSCGGPTHQDDYTITVTKP